MFREMRRKKQVLSVEENIQILNHGTSGVLAVSGDNDYPYAVPLSYVYHDNKIFFIVPKRVISWMLLLEIERSLFA